jgi:hypothetical protein
MSEQTLASAILRIERAVKRIEQVTQQRADGRDALARSLAVLEDRHAVLRVRIQETIDRLDGLIAAEGQD